MSSDDVEDVEDSVKVLVNPVGALAGELTEKATGSKAAGIVAGGTAGVAGAAVGALAPEIPEVPQELKDLAARQKEDERQLGAIEKRRAAAAERKRLGRRSLLTGTAQGVPEQTSLG